MSTQIFVDDSVNNLHMHLAIIVSTKKAPYIFLKKLSLYYLHNTITFGRWRLNLFGIVLN